MELIEKIEVLRRKIDQIDEPYLYSGLNSVDLIESAFWARSVLEVIGEVKFHKYNYTLKTSIRETNTPPNHLGMHTAVYTKDSIALGKLLNTIVHFRYFEYARYRDGNNCLQVQSDRNKELCQVFFSDFIEALKSLLIPRTLVALTVCDLVELELSEGKTSFFGIKNVSWLMGDFLKGEVELKLKVMQKFFGISDVPMETLRNRNFACGYGHKKLKLIYGEDHQGAFTESEHFDHSVLLDLIRQFCLDNRDW